MIETSNKKIPIAEVNIETIYVDNNSETHFRPFKDSVAIYRLILGSFFKYAFSSLISFAIDIGIFQLALNIIRGIAGQSAGFAIALATAIARVCSSLFNFAVNKHVVFKSDGKTAAMMLKYYLLCVCQAAISAGCVTLIWKFLHTEPVYIKIAVDVILFILSFQIQKRWVFAIKDKSC